MQESKIQQRAYILQEISKLKRLPAVSDSDVKASIENLSVIDDKAFLCTTLLREINGSVTYFDGVLSILAINLASDVLGKTIFDFLEKPSVSEEKKLFLINLLRQAGYAVEPDLIHLYVKNADELVDIETEKFLQLAEVNPEAQIDFLDFYFGINDADKNILLDSIIESYSGDMLANILAPLIYSLKNDASLAICINGLLNSKSYLAFAPLEWVINTSKNPSLVSLSKKIKNELKISGMRKDFEPLEYYSKLFSESKPLGFYVSPIDGSSNFSLVFARENNGAVSTFFAVLNLNHGPLSCFGLSNISKNEYENVLSRFFKDTDKIPLDNEAGRLLIDESIELAFKNNETVPYEILCWRQLTYDIKPVYTALSDFIKTSLSDRNIFKVNDIDIKRTTNCDYVQKWFFPYSVNYPEFMTLIDKICALDEKDFENFDILTKEFLSNSRTQLFLELKQRFLYQAYFLKCQQFKNLSSLFYSLYLDDTALKKVYDFSIKKSVYEFFLNLQNLKDMTDKNNVFAKQRKVKFFDFNSELMLKLIEKKWIS